MREIYIESMDNAKIKYLRKILNNNSFAKKEKLYMVETEKLINEVCENQNIEIVYNIYMESEYFEVNSQNNLRVSKNVFENLAEINSSYKQILFVKLNNHDLDFNSNLLVLDNIQDPGNMGTLIRSANAFNFKNILCLNSCSIYNPKVIRSAKGSLFDLNILSMVIEDGINKLIEEKYDIISTDLHGDDVNHFEFDDNKFALVLGNEGNGVSREIMLVSNKNVKIETTNVESLNVGVAGSILMYEFNKLQK